jgi:transcriptional antiterminator NusG
MSSSESDPMILDDPAAPVAAEAMETAAPAVPPPVVDEPAPPAVTAPEEPAERSAGESEPGAEADGAGAEVMAGEEPASEEAPKKKRPTRKKKKGEEEVKVEIRKTRPLKPYAPQEIEVPALAGPKGNFEWYVIKCQSNREDSIRDAVDRRLKLRSLEAFCEELVVPTEKVREVKAGKERFVYRKHYPGYILARMEMNEEVYAVVREVAGVGDFITSDRGKPQAMAQTDIDRILGRNQTVTEEEQPKLKINFAKDDRVKIKGGSFENFEGNVDEVNEAKGRVKVLIQVFGRATPVELEYWEVEKV